MSIATEIARIQTDRNAIRAKLVELGMATATDGLTALATAVDGIDNRGAISATVQEGDTYTIPKGYHNGSGTVSGVAGGGNYSLQSKTVTPTKNQQNVTPDSGYYGLSDVTVGAIPPSYQDVSGVTAVPDNVLTGKIFVNANGTAMPGKMPNNGAVKVTLDTETKSYTVPAGYHDGKGTVSISVMEAQTIVPSKTAQTISPLEGNVLSTVTVEAIPDNFVDPSSGTALAADILKGKTAFVTQGKVTGTMENNGATGGNIDGLTTTSISIPAGYTTGGTVSLTNDIENALKEI